MRSYYQQDYTLREIADIVFPKREEADEQPQSDGLPVPGVSSRADILPPGASSSAATIAAAVPAGTGATNTNPPRAAVQLTAEMRERIERNRLAAIEKIRARQAELAAKGLEDPQ